MTSWRNIALAVGISCFAAACTATTNDAGTTSDEPITITLLAHDSFTPTEGIFEDFTAETGIQISVVRSSDAGTLVTKAVLASGNPEGDVLWGIDNTLLSRALDADVFVPYVSIHQADLDASAVALAPNGAVTPVDTGDVCINYDKAWFAERNITPPLTTGGGYIFLHLVQSPISGEHGQSSIVIWKHSRKTNLERSWLANSIRNGAQHQRSRWWSPGP